MNADDLTEAERIELMRFMCSFAWADGEVQAGERVVLERVLNSLNLNPDDRAKAETWLSEAPDMTAFDFAAIPAKTRGVFVDHAFEVASADGGLAVEEMRHLKMFMSFTESG